jgi:hypothetical protein
VFEGEELEAPVFLRAVDVNDDALSDLIVVTSTGIRTFLAGRASSP